MKSGFTLIEVLLSIAIIAVLFGISSILLSNLIPKTKVSSVAEILISEIRQQQLKTMNGDQDSTGVANQFGIYLETHQYTLFEGGSYNPLANSNLVYDVNEPSSISTNFPNQTIVFTRGSGEIVGFTNGANSITVSDSLTSASQTINFNSYGVPN